MSTILKALRRLEQEKSSRSDRSLGEAVANTPPPPTPWPSRVPWLIAAGSLVAAFAVTAAVLLFFRGGDPPAPETATLAQAPAAEPARPKAARAPAARPARRVTRAPAPRAPQDPPGHSGTTAAIELPSAALTSPDVEVVERAKSPSADLEAGAPEPVVLRRREPPRPGSVAMRPLAPSEPVEPVAAEPAVEVAAVVPPSAPPQDPVAVQRGASEAAQDAPPASEPSAVTKAAVAVAPPDRVAPPDPAAARATGRESAAQSVSAPEAQATAPKSPPRPAALEAKAPVQVAAELSRAKPPPPRPAAKPTPAPEESASASAREVERALSAPPESSSVGRAADVFVERTIWHPISDRRIAIVSLGDGAGAVELREGDSLGPFVVGEIEPTGVYFYRGDEELRRRVGAR